MFLNQGYGPLENFTDSLDSLMPTGRVVAVEVYPLSKSLYSGSDLS
jgi:hypothetical protein